jgi:hypothetical protein
MHILLPGCLGLYNTMLQTTYFVKYRNLFLIIVVTEKAQLDLVSHQGLFSDS